MEFAGFDWDNGKCRQHGVSIAEIESLFEHVVWISPDVRHSAREERFKAIGSTGEGRNVFVVFTLRRRGGEIFVRPVSARYMHRKEVIHYEKATTRSQE